MEPIRTGRRGQCGDWEAPGTDLNNTSLPISWVTGKVSDSYASASLVMEKKDGGPVGELSEELCPSCSTLHNQSPSQTGMLTLSSQHRGKPGCGHSIHTILKKGLGGAGL